MPSVTISDLLQQLHNARDFGADASGNRDASGAIQAALAAASAAGGGIVYVPPGIYRLGSNVSFSGLDNVTLWLSNGVSATGAGAFPTASGTCGLYDMRNGATPSTPLSDATPTASAVGDNGAAGVAQSASRSDHEHPREAFGAAGDIVTQAFGDSPAAGATGKVADAGHKHGMPSNPGGIRHALMLGGG